LIFPFLILPAQEEKGIPGIGRKPDPRRSEASRREELLRILRERSFPFEERSLYAEYGGFGSSIHLSFPSADLAAPGGTQFVLAVPLSAAGKENGEGLPFRFEAALAFIEKIRSGDTGTDIRVAFLGDEVQRLPEEFQKRPHIGLEDLYNTLNNPEDTVLWYLDADAAPREITIHHGTADTIAPLSILRSLPELCEKYHLPYRFAVRSNELYKLRLIDGPSVLRFAQSREINALYISGEEIPFSGASSGGAPGETLQAENFAAMLVSYTASLRVSAENLDYHFTIIRLLGKIVFISEPLTMIFLLTLAALFFFALLMYSVLYRHILLIRWQIFLRRSWVILVFLAFLVITLQGGGVLLSLLSKRLRILQPAGAYGEGALKLIFAMVLFSFLYPIPELFRIPRKEDFYGSTAVLLVTLGVLIAAFLDITLVPMFLWAFLFIFLGACIKKPFLVRLFALVTPMQATTALLTILRFGNGKLAEILRSDNPFINFYFAVILLPFILIFKRGDALSRKRKSSPPLKVRLIPRLVLLAVSIGAGSGYIAYMAKQPAQEPVRRTIVETSGERGILNARTREIDFLERRITEVYLEARGNPVRFDMYLSSDKGVLPVVYSAPVPFEFSAEGDSLEFILGEGPPNPFSTEIVIPLDFTGFLRVEALYTLWDGTLDAQPPPEKDDYVLRVVRTIPISP
jgi:hypothetical protein